MKLKKFFDNFEEIVGTILFVIMFAVLVAQIVSRQVFDAPLVWSEELAILLYVYIGMLGVSMGIKYRQHVMIDFLYKKFSVRGTRIAHTVIQAIVLISLLIIIFIGIKLFQRKLIFELIALKISAGWMYASLPLVGTLMLYRFINVCFQEHKEGKFVFSPMILIENEYYSGQGEGE
ncbi:TRAP transporter small permease [Cetobacterium sp. 2A]|nr:TRAP transporter small permease [Cetobacterium sp. 2A]